MKISFRNVMSILSYLRFELWKKSLLQAVAGVNFLFFEQRGTTRKRKFRAPALFVFQSKTLTHNVSLFHGSRKKAYVPSVFLWIQRLDGTPLFSHLVREEPCYESSDNWFMTRYFSSIKKEQEGGVKWSNLVPRQLWRTNWRMLLLNKNSVPFVVLLIVPQGSICIASIVLHCSQSNSTCTRYPS